MNKINLYKSKDFDWYHYLDVMPIRTRRDAIDFLLKNQDIPLPDGAELSSDDWIPAENPDLIQRLAVPFVVGYKYYIKQEPRDGLGYFLAAVKVGDEEKLLFSKVNGDESHLHLLSKNQLRFPEKSDHINYRW